MLKGGIITSPNLCMLAVDVEAELKKDVARCEKAIAEVNRQIAALNQKRSEIAPSLTTGSADPIAEAQAAVEAERRARDFTDQQSALYAVLAKYQASLAETKQQIAEIQQQRGLSASRALITATNEELVGIAKELEEVRQRQKELLIQAVKVANRPEVEKACKALKLGNYLDLWIPERGADGFDSPNLGKMGQAKLASGDRLNESDPFQRWSIVSQQVISRKDFKNG